MPASGYRIYTSGDLTVVGSYGYYWSSSPYASGNANGGSLSFTPSDVTLLGGLQRARGFSVRCVQHLRAAFFKVKVEKRKVENLFLNNNINPHSTSKLFSGGRTKSVSGGAGVLCNPANRRPEQC